MRPQLSAAPVVHTGKWSLTNLFHYGNDLHDWTPREPESLQDWFHHTAINSLPMGGLRSHRWGKRLRRPCLPAIDHGTRTTTKNPIQSVSIQAKLAAPQSVSWWKISLLFFINSPLNVHYYIFYSFHSITTSLRGFYENHKLCMFGSYQLFNDQIQSLNVITGVGVLGGLVHWEFI